MTLKEALKVLLDYPERTRDRPGTCYGGTSNVYECSCCGYALSWGDRHAEDCELAAALRVVEKEAT